MSDPHDRFCARIWRLQRKIEALTELSRESWIACGLLASEVQQGRLGPPFVARKPRDLFLDIRILGSILPAFVSALFKGRLPTWGQVLDGALIFDSGLFDGEFYCREYPDVKTSGLDPLIHFVMQGAGQCRNPNAMFDTAYYLEQCQGIDPDVINPLAHYIRFGVLERRRPNPDFEPMAYIVQHPDVIRSRANPLTHFLRTGGKDDQVRLEKEVDLDLRYAELKGGMRYPVREAEGSGAPVNLDRLRLHWILPEFGPGEGGVMNVFRMVRALERAGHENTIWINYPGRYERTEHIRNLIRTDFMPIEGEVRFVPEDPGVIEGDAVIATDHWTAYAARAVHRVKRRFYFVQDFEPMFYPVGDDFHLAEATYRFGFDCLCNGPWLASLMAERFGAWTRTWSQAFDPTHYYSGSNPERIGNRIAFYARYTTPRRAVKLGLLAFEALRSRYDIDFHVDFFGEWEGALDVPYAYTDHGVISADELGELYRAATVGVAFSSTNYSIVTREMIACALPVLDLDVESVRAVYPPGTLALAEPNPDRIADELYHLLSDRQYRNGIVEKALDFVRPFTWDQAARDVETGIKERLAEP